MTGIFGGSQPATQTTQQGNTAQTGQTAGISTYAPNAYVQQAYQDLLNRAQGVSQTPFQPYGGQFTAGFTPEQYAGVGNINQNVNYPPPYIQGAYGLDV